MRWTLTSTAFAVLVPSVLGQSCISLSGSTQCPGFAAASIATNDTTLNGRYSWLATVTSAASFDSQLAQNVNTTYIQYKYTNIFGCSNVDPSNRTDYYARYTKSFICNDIVQNSIPACNLQGAAARPLCAESCSSFAETESEIVLSNDYCPTKRPDYLDLLRADFTNCALPSGSITNACITGATNEPNNCGFSDNLIGLCNYCRASTTNATDSCCFTSNATGRCQDVRLPVFSSVASFAMPTASSTAGPSAAAASGRGGLSGGAIAGIVIGSVVGFLILLGLVIFFCVTYRRRRQDSSGGSILNQPSPPRRGGDVSAMTYNPPASAQNFEVLPGGRVARMSAIQNDDVGQPARPAQHQYGPADGQFDSPPKIPVATGAIKMSPRSHGSSPGSNDYSSPEGVASGQSEQLPYFKDYYSNDDIHPNDKVSVLWAYQPRAGDEFELERGDMLKVVGIWDDGWATGVRIDDRAEDYDGKNKLQRDSGVSNGSVEDDSPVMGEIKAFPLVCVCLPEAWRKTVEGDSSTESTSGGPQPQ